MRYIVDGHNLIPKLGLRLDSFDDEEALIGRLQEFCRIRQAQVEVYFDGATAGMPSKRKAGAVNCHFVRAGSSADSAIEERLVRMGKQARNWILVSSDRRVQTAGRASHAKVLSSEEFGREVAAASQVAISSKRENGLGPDEVEEWLSFFKTRKG